MILKICIAIGIILLFAYLRKMLRRRKISSKIQGPKGIPLLGYIKLFSLSLEDLFTHLIELSKNYEGYYKLWLGPELWVVVYEPELVEKMLLNQKLVKANDYKYLKPWLGNGLLTNEGKSWFARRKAITPAFHFNILEDFIEVFDNQADVLVQKLKTLNDSEDIMLHLVLCAFDIICETAMGIRMNAQTHMDSEYVKAVKNICQIVYTRMFNPFLDSDFIFRLTKHYKPHEKNIKIVHEATQKIIEERRKLLNEIESNTYQEDEFENRKKMALLDILLKTSIDGKPLNDCEIREEVNTFMFAGHDTTSTTLGFLLYNIAKHPEVQRKLSEEISYVFEDNPIGSDVTLNRLNKLKYLDMVIKESMRIHTTVPFIGRQLLEETEINNILFPENSNLSIWVYGLCHREDLFPEPDKFIPERFSDENKMKLNPFAYIPFSAGHRNCIGQKFALLQMKTIVTRILQNFEIILAEPDKDLILVAEIVLKSKNGIRLKFKNK